MQIGRARFRAPELLFQPHLIGEECEGIQEVLAYSVQKSDMDLRKTFYSNIILSGGSTLFKGKPRPIDIHAHTHAVHTYTHTHTQYIRTRTHTRSTYVHAHTHAVHTYTHTHSMLAHMCTHTDTFEVLPLCLRVW